MGLREENCWGREGFGEGHIDEHQTHAHREITREIFSSITRKSGSRSSSLSTPIKSDIRRSGMFTAPSRRLSQQWRSAGPGDETKSQNQYAAARLVAMAERVFLYPKGTADQETDGGFTDDILQNML